jgi:hypothetical protein
MSEVVSIICLAHTQPGPAKLPSAVPTGLCVARAPPWLNKADFIYPCVTSEFESWWPAQKTYEDMMVERSEREAAESDEDFGRAVTIADKLFLEISSDSL